MKVCSERKQDRPKSRTQAAGRQVAGTPPGPTESGGRGRSLQSETTSVQALTDTWIRLGLTGRLIHSEQQRFRRSRRTDSSNSRSCPATL